MGADPGGAARTVRERGVPGFQVAAGICVLVLATGVAAQWEARFALDDALMFARYADHLLAGLGMAWNAGERSVFGPTSPAFVPVVAGMRAILGGSPSLGVQAASLLCGVVAVALMARIARREGGTYGIPATLLVLAGLAAWTESLSAHFTTGMDTTFAMALLAGHLLAIRSMVEQPGDARVTLVTAAVGAAAFVVRPDLLVFAVVVPLVVAASAAGSSRVHWLGAGGGAAAGALLTAGCAWLATGTPLPLSFYAKSLHGYGAYFAAQYEHVAPAEFVDFASGYWLLALPLAADLIVNRGRWRSSELAVERGVVAATALFLGYHLFLTLPIMPYKERFFQPAVPALAFLAAGATGRLFQGTHVDFFRRLHPALPAILVLVVLSPAGVESAKALRKERMTGGFGDFDLIRMYRVTSKPDMWFALDRFSRLPDDLTLAATEVGLPGALNPRKRLIDLAGLNDRGFATEGFTARRLFGEYKPDLIYLPHPHYDRMIQAMIRDPRFEQDYLVYSRETLGTTLGLALRRDSPYFESMRTIAEEELDRRRRAE